MNNYFAKIEGDTWEEKLETCLECKCCNRHNTNKPLCLAPWIDTPFHNTNINSSDCSCPCRHNARFICRLYNSKQCPKYSEWKKNQDNSSSGYLTD